MTHSSARGVTHLGWSHHTASRGPAPCKAGIGGGDPRQGRSVFRPKAEVPGAAPVTLSHCRLSRSGKQRALWSRADVISDAHQDGCILPGPGRFPVKRWTATGGRRGLRPIPRAIFLRGRTRGSPVARARGLPKFGSPFLKGRLRGAQTPDGSRLPRRYFLHKKKKFLRGVFRG